MIGGFETSTLIVLVIATAGILDYMGMINIMPTTKKNAGIIGVVALVIGGSMAGWWAIPGLQGADEAPVEDVDEQLVNVNITNSDSSDAQITEESDLDGYWKTEYTWDSSNTQENFGSSELTKVVADVDLIWNAATSAENDVYTFAIEVGKPVPVVENEDDSSFDTKKVFDYDTTEDVYNITIAPSGGSTTDMKGYASVTPGGSKTVTITFNLDTSSNWGKHVETYDEVKLPVEFDVDADGQTEVTRTLRLMRVG